MLRWLLFALSLLCLFANPARAQDATAAPFPAAMPLVDEGGQDILNLLLIGSATNNPNNPGLTDSLMVVSINRSNGGVSIVSIPRDLYVYVAGFGMNKINTAYYYGETKGAGGIPLLKDTISYNLGLTIDFYARVNFNGFSALIDAVGGVDITVDCAIRDWRLISPELDKQDANNWQPFTLDVGWHHMDGDLALWYVRSRKTSSDLDRGRRQQDVLRALWRTIRAQGTLNQLPTVWAEVTKLVDTDLALPDMLGLVPLALTLDTSDITYYRFRQKHEVANDISPAGQQVLMPQREAVATLMQTVVLPPNANQAALKRPTVLVINSSGIPGLASVAADRLELDGFATFVQQEAGSYRQYNHIVDSSGASKGNPISVIQKTLRVTDEGIEVLPDPARAYDFTVYIGSQYQFWSCTRDVLAVPTATPTPASP